MKKILLLTLFIICTTACADAPKQQTKTNTEKVVAAPKIPTTWLAAYMGLKDALVQTDAAQAKTIAAEFVRLLEDVESSSLSTDDKKAVTDVLPGMRYDLEQIQELEIDKQRVVFKALSEKSITLAGLVGVGTTVYQQHCPMYAGGSSWLSFNEEIRNPYYGDKMLKCGVVEATLAP